MGFKAGHEDWRSNSAGRYIHLENDSISVIYTMEIALHPQWDNIPAARTERNGWQLSRSWRTEWASRDLSLHLSTSKVQVFSTASLSLVWGQHGYYCSTCLILLRDLEILKLDDEIWILLGGGGELAQYTWPCFAPLLDWNLIPRVERRMMNTLNYLVLFNVVPRPYRISSSTSLLSTD